MNLEFDSKARKQLEYWNEKDRKIARKIFRLIENIEQTPFAGIGKPEALKYDYSGWWARRINKEHRLIYKIEKQTIVILSCRYHY